MPPSSARVGRAASDAARQKMVRNRLNLRNTQGDAMLRNNADEKAEIYETLSSMSRAFAGIVQHLQTLQRTGLFIENGQTLSEFYPRASGGIQPRISLRLARPSA